MSYTSPTLRQVVDGQLCAGCGACVATTPRKISIGLDDAGFARPTQHSPLHAAEENKLRKVCPSISMKQDAAGREDHPLWGPYISVFTGHATDDRLRHHASSGGALSALLVHLVKTRAVEFVVQTGANSDHPLGNQTVMTEGDHQIYKAAGSRYAPSSPLAGLETYLARGRPFAFVGKPCDVAALRALALQDERIDELVPYMISFFCAGVPSLKGAEEIVQTLGAEPEEVSDFRYRGDGWPGEARATLKDGSSKAMSYNDSWGKILTKHLQFRCKICPDGVGGFADIVFADAWHCDEAGYPLFDDKEGRSLIVTRTNKGKDAFQAALESKSIEAEALPIEDIKAMQPGQVRRKKLVLSRLSALRVLFRATPRFSGFQLSRAASKAGFFANLKSFLGAGKRVVFNQR